LEYINRLSEQDGHRVIIFSTLVNAQVRAIIRTANAFMLDLFDTFISPLEVELGVKSSGAIGKLHGIDDTGRYHQRIEAINFALGLATMAWPRNATRKRILSWWASPALAKRQPAFTWPCSLAF